MTIPSSGQDAQIANPTGGVTSRAEKRTTTEPVADAANFVTVAEFKELEKANLTAALKHTDWKTWSPDGAAELLGMKPSTLTYRMKALGIIKPGKRD